MIDKEAVFNKAMKFVLRWEGGYVNHPNDPGGATNKGVTQAVYDQYRKNKKLQVQTVKNITDAEVYDIYRRQYFDPISAGLDSEDLIICAMDFAVNSGVSRSKKYLLLTKDPIKFNDNREIYYKKIVANNPKLSVFLKGWMNRLNDLRDYIKK